MIPLGGNLALVSVGQWDEESATTIQMPAVPADPADDPRDDRAGDPAADSQTGADPRVTDQD